MEQAIRAVWTGHTYITPLIAKDLLDVLLTTGSKQPQLKKTLTFRQREVWQLLSEGRTAKDIALRLKISTRTVEFHKAQIMNQLNLRTTAELIKYALTHGVLASS